MSGRKCYKGISCKGYYVYEDGQWYSASKDYEKSYEIKGIEFNGMW